ncbi:MAG: hypothetical protein AB7D38_11980 [Sulfurimonas sp.]|uniref:hypothetical protein n=1 Tax=Sulfurimonas sp. TaxID=2022749 RepID=UPI003D0D7C8E
METPENNSDFSTEQEKNQELPSKLEPEVDFEKRFKDTQASFTKARQENAVLKAKVQKYEEMLTATPQLTAEQAAELEELKFSDPDKWYAKKKELENYAFSAIKTEVDGATEMARRQQVFADFMQANPGVVINDDIIKYDIPRRITAKLDSGEITFEDFLTEAVNYLTAPKTVKTEKVTKQPDLSKVGGDDTPLDTSGSQAEIPYKQTLF